MYLDVFAAIMELRLNSREEAEHGRPGCGVRPAAVHTRKPWMHPGECNTAVGMHYNCILRSVPRLGIALAMECGAQHDYIKTNCLNFWSKLQSANMDRSLTYHNISEVKILKNFFDCMVCHVRRLGNAMANQLANSTCLEGYTSKLPG